MKLLTKALSDKLVKNSDANKDPLVLAHYFNPTGRGDWFAIKYYPRTHIMFGYVSLFGDHNDELGDFYMGELEDFKGQFGLGIERDLSWQPTPLSEVRAKVTVR